MAGISGIVIFIRGGGRVRREGGVERGGEMGEEEVLGKKGGREHTAGGSRRVETNAEGERTLSGQGSNPPPTAVQKYTMFGTCVNSEGETWTEEDGGDKSC